MLLESYRVLVIPLWAVTLAAFVLSAPSGVMPSLIALLGIALIVWTMPTIVRRLRSRPLVEVLPALDDERTPVGHAITEGIVARTLDEAIDARTIKVDEADLLRLDDDGGRRLTRPPVDGRPPVTNDWEHSNVYEDHVR